MIGQIRAYLPTGLKEHQRSLVVVLGATAGTLVFIKLVKSVVNKARLRQKRKAKLRACQKAIELLSERVRESQISDEQMENICKLGIQELTQKLQSGDLKAIDVLRAYQKKALQVNNKTNAIIDVVQEAEAAALECDKIVDRSKRPLHGLPVSIKDNFPMEGYDSIIGLSCNIGKPYSKDCVLVKVLKDQGAIPFVRTNVPQTMIGYDTCNPIFGQTYNPHGEGRNAGGSSGGEAALIGGGGSPLGLGGDIGGSIRIPAVFCGICGFKPTATRLSTRDANPIFKGQNLITSAYGPMARDVDSLVLMIRALLCQYHFELDKTVPPMSFNEEVFKQTRKLRIGFYLEDDYMISVPAMQRAVSLSVTALQNQGHEVIPWKFPNLGLRGAILWSKVLFADKGEELLGLLKDDATDHAFGLAKTLITMNNLAFNIINFIARQLYPRIGLTFSNLHGLKSVSEWQQLVKDVMDFRQEVEEDLRKKSIDILLAPGFTMPAPPVGYHQQCTGAASYTSCINVLNFPAGTLPVTTVTAEDVANMADYPTPDPWHKTVKKSMIGAEGLPVGVQVIGLPWQEEATLRIMKELETALQK